MTYALVELASIFESMKDANVKYPRVTQSMIVALGYNPTIQECAIEQWKTKVFLPLFEYMEITTHRLKYKQRIQEIAEKDNTIISDTVYKFFTLL